MPGTSSIAKRSLKLAGANVCVRGVMEVISL